MMKPRNWTSKTVAVAGLCLAAAWVVADPIVVHKYDVIPVRFDSQLSTADNRPGDPFTATPEDEKVFPRGTRIEGHVVRVSQKTSRHPASMDLAFDDVKLPDGTRTDIRGVPIPLSSNYVDKDADGRYVAKAQVRKETAVGVGALAGFVIGALLHRPFEGTFVGTLAGILVADTAGDDRALVINRGSEAGVLFQSDVRFDRRDDALPTPDRPSGPATNSSSLNVTVAGKAIQYTRELAPFQAGSTLMVPIEFTAKQLGLSYEEAESSIFTENDSHSLRFEENTTTYRVDGRSDTLDAAVIQRNGVWYAPAHAFDAINAR